MTTFLQVVGLKYHEDLQHRIPRSEVQMAEDAIRQAVMEVLPSRRIDDASDPLYAYCMGSYLRGKPATGKHPLAFPFSKRPFAQLLTACSLHQPFVGRLQL